MKTRIIVTILIVVCTLISYKRGPFLIGLIGVLVFYFIEYAIDKNVRNGRLVTIIASCIVLGCVYYLIQDVLLTDDMLLSRYDNAVEDRGSGRFDIWQATLSSFSESNIVSVIFGHGMDSVRSVAGGKTSHNDYLEVLFDYGLIGFGLFISFIIKLMKYGSNLLKTKSNNASVFISSIIIFILSCFISHVFVYTECMLFFVITWGIILGEEVRKIDTNEYI